MSVSLSCITLDPPVLLAPMAGITDLPAREVGRPEPAPEGAALVDLVAGYYEAMLGFYGRELGVRVARKHLGWYLDGIAGGARLRDPLVRLDGSAAVLRELRAGLADLPAPAGLAA
jgi:tRNA-dihydrouridine synthase B